ncbi:MAG: hypothetical protein KatS3mg087_1848 [Patescibacteria group bacterium]|nr:MAG: hypothetical protein KatS3mg087_1848 [Patescibacteria group bacterium]
MKSFASVKAFFHQHKEIIFGFLIAAMLSTLTVAIYIQMDQETAKQKPKESIQINASVTPESNEQQALKNQTLNWQKKRCCKHKSDKY